MEGKAGPGKLKGVLVLKDGSVFRGDGFGYPTKVVGEVVFSTGMVGYTESLTDPSYAGQILTLTYPLVGNYGVPDSVTDEFGLPIYFESEKIQAMGLVIHDLSSQGSHWSSRKTLHEWLYSERIPGIFGIDTRELTKKIRKYGVIMGALECSAEDIETDSLVTFLEQSKSYDEINFVEASMVKTPITYGNSSDRLVLLDCGVKLNIVRNLLRRGFEVVRLPCTATVSEIMSYDPAGLVLSNGPGDPKLLTKTVKTVKELVTTGMPTLGICLGNQILALALGGDTYKLKYGHRGQNKPCILLPTGSTYVTTQNHGYAVDEKSLVGTGLDVWFINADDRTIEGIRHREMPCLAVQFHPEAAPGPYDTSFVFDEFVRVVKKHSKV